MHLWTVLSGVPLGRVEGYVDANAQRQSHPQKHVAGRAAHVEEVKKNWWRRTWMLFICNISVYDNCLECMKYKPIYGGVM